MALHETYITVSERWMYLYRAVDACGQAVTSQPTRDITAAKAFFRKPVQYHGKPLTSMLDGFAASHSTLGRMGMRSEFNYRWYKPVKIRVCQHLNSIVESDHRRIKLRVQPMFGFK
jgi:putative transposase